MKVFLGGTCNNSKWREKVIEGLKMDYFNPVVEIWTEECKRIERQERESCDFVLYVITPKMSGVYSIAEIIDDSNKRPEKCIFSFLNEDDGLKFTDDQYKSLLEVGRMVIRNGGTVLDFDNITKFLNMKEVFKCDEDRYFTFVGV